MILAFLTRVHHCDNAHVRFEMQYRTALLILITAVLCYLGFQGREGRASDIAQLLFIISLILLAIDLARNLLRSQDRRDLNTTGKDGDKRDTDNSPRDDGAGS